jgi:integrase
MQQQERDRLRAGELWQDHGLVFASRIGTPLTANNVIRAFRIITKKACLGDDWVPREMRHTFVSVLSANGVPVEDIALLAGHDRTATTESVYRHAIRPLRPRTELEPRANAISQPASHAHRLPGTGSPRSP